MTEKWVQLFQLLLERTREGTIFWSETADSDAYLVSIGKNKVLFGNGAQYAGGYGFSILSKEGKVVDAFDIADIERLTGFPWHEEAEEMFNAIRRRISGADDVLDDILSELNDPNPF